MIEIFATIGIVAVVALALLVVGIWANWPKDGPR